MKQENDENNQVSVVYLLFYFLKIKLILSLTIIIQQQIMMKRNGISHTHIQDKIELDRIM